MDNLGIAKLVVGIEITRQDVYRYFIFQSIYAEAMLEQFGMSNTCPASTPSPPGFKLYRETDHEVEEFMSKKLPYRGVVGSLMYLAQCTRPDLGHSVGVLSQHLERPGTLHWDAAMHFLRYLRGSTNLGILYSADAQSKVSGMERKHCPVSHCNADWAGDRSTRRSTTGYVFTLAGGALSWRSRLQPTVALSSTEAEYRAITEAGQELLWLRKMMSRLGFEDTEPTTLQSENLGAIHLTS